MTVDHDECDRLLQAARALDRRIEAILAESHDIAVEARRQTLGCAAAEVFSNDRLRRRHEVKKALAVASTSLVSSFKDLLQAENLSVEAKRNTAGSTLSELALLLAIAEMLR